MHLLHPDSLWFTDSWHSHDSSTNLFRLFPFYCEEIEAAVAPPPWRPEVEYHVTEVAEDEAPRAPEPAVAAVAPVGAVGMAGIAPPAGIGGIAPPAGGWAISEVWIWWFWWRNLARYGHCPASWLWRIWWGASGLGSCIACTRCCTRCCTHCCTRCTCAQYGDGWCLSRPCQPSHFSSAFWSGDWI